MINETYRTYLIEQIIKQFLFSQQNPTTAAVNQALEQALINFPDQTQPQILAYQDLVKAESHKTANPDTYNQLFQIIHQDLLVLHQECLKQSQDQLCFLERHEREMSLLSRHIRKLQHNLGSALLVNQDTVGYLHYLADNFSDASLVDLSQTTAALNLTTHCASLGTGAPSFLKLSTTQLTLADCQIAVQTRYGLVGTSVNLDNLLSVFQSDASTWRSQLKYQTSDQEVVLEIRVKLAPQAVAVNRINFTNYTVGDNKTILSVQYSTDNYNWIDLPTEPLSRYLDEAADLIFPTQDMQWLKFRLSKSDPDYIDQGVYVYEFGAKNISFYNYVYGSAGILVSKALSPVDNYGNQIDFNAVSLEVCEAIPDGCGIDYSLSFDQGNNFLPICPLGSNQSNVSKVLTANTLVDIRSPDFVVSLDATNTYYLANQSISLSHDILLAYTLAQDMVLQNYSFWRNIGLRGIKNPVRNGIAGWKVDGEYYISTIQVNQSDGIVINLGASQMEIDGTWCTGHTAIIAGKHTVRTHKNNWSQLYLSSNPSVVVTSFLQAVDNLDGTFTGKDSSDSALTVRDPLYPYNHKLLIEGVSYLPEQMSTTNPVYIGIDLFAECLMTRVSEFDLINNVSDNDMTKFALITTGSPAAQYFLVKYLPLSQDPADRYTNETFRLYYKQQESTSIEDIIFKASLTSNSPTISPQLYYYIIKLGMEPAI
jgi:hypothetical protein